MLEKTPDSVPAVPERAGRSDDRWAWELTTHEGNRRRQHLEFLALSLPEKVLRIEEMAEVAAHFAARRVMRGREGESGRRGDASDRRDA